MNVPTPAPGVTSFSNERIRAEASACTPRGLARVSARPGSVSPVLRVRTRPARPRPPHGISRPAQGPPRLEIRIRKTASGKQHPPAGPCLSHLLARRCSMRTVWWALTARLPNGDAFPSAPHAIDENSGVEHRGFRSCVAHLPGGVRAARPRGIGRNHGAVHANTTPALAGVPLGGPPESSSLDGRLRTRSVTVRDLAPCPPSSHRLCGPHV